MKRLLPKLNKAFKFRKSRFTQKDLNNYATLKSVIDSLLDFTRLQGFKYKKIDKGLWVYAKYIYKADELPDSIIKKIQRAAKKRNMPKRDARH